MTVEEQVARVLAVFCGCGETEVEHYHADEAKALKLAGLLAPGEHEEWGLRYLNTRSEPVYLAEDGEASARAAMTPGDVLVHRYVSDWLPVEAESP